MRSGPSEAVAEEGVEIGEVVEEVEEINQTLQVQRQGRIPDTRVQSTQTFRLVNGPDVRCTSNMVVQLFSALNQGRVRGKTSSWSSLPSETVTSLATQRNQL